MTWLLNLYPRRWRRRYGEEFRALLGAQPFSIGAMIDVISGAIDAWIYPQMMVAVQTVAAAEGEQNMLAKTMRFRCAGYGPEVTRADQWKSLAVMVGVTIVLSLGWMWLHVRSGDNPYVDSFSLMPFLIGLLLSMRYTNLKARSAQTQAVFIAGSIMMLTLLFALVGWITARM
jgi:hypothetical protein